MATHVQLFLLIASVLRCNGVSLRRQLEHIAKSQKESQGFPDEAVSARRSFYNYDPREVTNILGAPSLPSHLPEAEPILPGHTLIKPALGMLKSSVKFPHRDLEDGSGVYGHYENIGIRYDAKNERVLYTGFRRMPTYDVTGGDTVLGDNTKKYLYKNNNEPFNKKRNRGDIYLKRIYVSKLPTAFKNIGNNLKTTIKNHPKLLRSDIENDITNAEADDYKEINLIVFNKQDTKKPANFWNSKNTFNHIAINQSAPDYADIFPFVNHGKPRQWWFFNEEDLHRPLQTK